MNEIDLRLNESSNYIEDIEKFINELASRQKDGAVVKVTVLDEKYISASRLECLLSNYTCLWFLNEKIELEDSLVTKLSVYEDIAVSLIITTSGEDYFMIRGSTAVGFINEPIPAAKAADIASAISRVFA